ncbi:hypothetical protein ACM0P6_15290 (plasmid) [Komagataeibacter sucrofermentans]|uniref:hypothetical protein n=1 Tax=Komagataeibacter sucrofermentans TaxID=1053551 RepID=UPI00142DED1D|nr:hypothetical protein [Komagataeibacter sucrofermentans]GBQ51480.1 hypothetical protein AA15973_2415 [Komagataeibacter sucrofermentans DSM 15973]
MFIRDGDIEYLAKKLFSQRYPFRKWEVASNLTSGGATEDEKEKFMDMARRQLSSWHPV